MGGSKEKMGGRTQQDSIWVFMADMTTSEQYGCAEVPKMVWGCSEGTKSL